MMWGPTQQTIYSTLLDAMRLKVPELIRRFDDNLRPKASNLRLKVIIYNKVYFGPKTSIILFTGNYV